MKNRGFLASSNIILPWLYFSIGYFYDCSFIRGEILYFYVSIFNQKNPYLSSHILHEAVLSNMSWQEDCENRDPNTFLHIKNT